MSWKRGALLVLCLTFGIVAHALFSALYGNAHYRIVGQYVDFDCRPVPTARYEFRAFMSSRFPYSGGAERRHAGLTDARGRFTVDFETTWSLDRIEIALSQQNDERRGWRRFDPFESMNALESTESAPVHIYRQHPSMIENRMTGRGQVRLHYQADGGSWRHRGRQHSGELRTFLDTGLRWHREGDRWLLTLTAHKRGGFIEYPLDQLPFEANIPFQGYRKSVQMRLPDTDDPAVSKAYYYRHDDGSAYGTLVISASYGGQYEKSVLLTLAHDILLNEQSSTAAPVLPPYACSGTAAQDYDGVPATASPSARQLVPARPASSWAQIAADPDTPIEWFEIRLHDPDVLRNAVASYGEVPERYPLIYRGSRDWLRARLSDKTDKRLINWRNNPVVRLASDERTPPDILLSIERDFPVVPIARALSANPNMPQAALARLVDGLLSGTYESVERPSGTRQTMTTLAAIPRLDPSTFQKVSAHLLDARVEGKDLGYAPRYLLENPGVPASILTAWVDHALTNDGVWMVRYLFAHANTDVADLYRLSEKFFRGEYWNKLSPASQYFRRRNLPHEILARYVAATLGEHVSRDALLALVHPGFDRDVLYGMLTLENQRLVKKLLGLVSYSRSAPLRISVKQTHAPAAVIRYIYDLPGSEIFHRSIADNSNTPVDILEALLAGESVDWALIRNPALSEKQIRTLQDRLPYENARQRLADNPATPADILEQIALEDPPVHTLVENPSTPPGVLRMLYREHFRAAQRRGELVKQLLNHPNITADLMEEVLLQEEEADLVEIAAMNPVTDASIIEKIAAGDYAAFFFESSDALSRRINDALAANPATPWHVKRKLRRY